MSMPSAGSLIHGYEDVVATSNKMLKVAKVNSYRELRAQVTNPTNFT